MRTLLASAVGIPVLSIVLFALLEAVGGSKGFWGTVNRVGLDLCIVGGMFLHKPLLDQLGPASPIVAMFVSLLEMIFAAVVMLVDKRWQTGTSQVKAYVSLFIGVFAVGLPSGIIMWVGGPR